MFLIGGPVPEKFAGKEISRTIQIRGDQTLEDLHHAIFEAFDRFDEHFYEFQFGKGPNDPKGKRYVLPQSSKQDGQAADHRRRRDADDHRLPGAEGRTSPSATGSTSATTGGTRSTWLAIDDKVPKGKYPKVIKRVGKSPPQYMDE